MTGNETRLRAVGQPTLIEPETETPKASLLDKAATEMLLLGLKALSQKTLIALGNIFTLASTASVFVLAYILAPQPSVNQLIELTLYGSFILLLHLIRKDK